MDVIKEEQIQSKPIEKVIVDPLVLLSIVDNYNRVAVDTRKRVIGVLLGSSSKGTVAVTNSYAVPFEEEDKDPSIWFLDHNYLESMFSRINAKEHVVGWYSTGPELRENDLEIHQLFHNYVQNPVLVIIDVQPKELGIPTKAYYDVEEVKENAAQKSQKVFVHVPSEIAAHEVEEIGVEHLLWDVKDSRIKFNVGGKLFKTTISTLQSAGPDSLLSTLSTRATPDTPIFIDRDPEIFSVLLSLLRSDRIPSSAGNRFSKQELADEALYYGIESLLKSASTPPPLSGIDASRITHIRPSSDGFTSAFTASGDGSVWIAHGGQISAYDWNLIHSSTIRTHLDDITSIRRVTPEVAVFGSNSASGLHFYDFCGSRHVGSVHWTDQTDPRIYKARVCSIADSSNQVFASFECQHRENCILAIDKSTLQIVSEIARQNGSSSKTTVPTKLTWMPDMSVVVGTAVTSGAFGYSGYIRIWDQRNGDIIWETNEPGSGRSSRFGDSFADVDVDVENLSLFKICSKSGDIAMADLRKLGDDPWMYVNDKNPSMRFSGGLMESVIHCYRNQVFVGREGSLEVWSKVAGRENSPGRTETESSINEDLYRRNFVDKMEDSERGVIKKIEGGGNRLFVCRENIEGIEVWESSYLSGAVSVL